MSGVYDFSAGFNSINNAINSLDNTLRERKKQQTLGNIGAQIAGGDYTGAAQKMLTLGDINSGLKLLEYGQNQGQASNATNAFNSAIMPAGFGASIPAVTPAVNAGNGNDVEGRFMTGIHNAGLTSPAGLGAVAAYGRAESGFSPRNANRIWADTSESGQPGMSGGVMSWRGDRLRNLYKFAAQRGEMQGNITPETQAAFLASEDPQLIPRLNAAKTPEEANQIMANSWRFAGYDRPGGENARRLAMAQRYAAFFGGNAGEQVASADAADMPAAGAQPAQGYFVPGQTQQQGQGRGFDAASAQRRVAHLQSLLGHPGLNDGQRQAIMAELNQVMKAADPASAVDLENKQLQNIRLQREIAGEGAMPLTPEERAAFGVPEGVPAHRTRSGEIKYGPARTTIDLSQRQEVEESKQRSQSAAKFLSGIADSSGSVAQRSADLDMLGRVISRTPTGAGTDTRAFLDRVGAAIGLSSGELATQADAVTAIVNRIAPSLREPGSGPMSDADLRLFLSSLPNLMALPEGNQLILSTLKRAAGIDRARTDIAALWQAGELSASEARKQIAAIDRQSIYASEQEKEMVANLLGGTSQQGKTEKARGGWKIIGVE